MLESIVSSGNLAFLSAGALAIVCGFLIGAERESRGKTAGVSTHILVIFGAMFFTMLSHTIEPENAGRIAANIVTGIGFLGAGLILKNQEGNVYGLTTATSVWFAAAIGMSLGFGYYFWAIVGTVVSAFAPRIPHVPWAKKKR